MPPVPLTTNIPAIKADGKAIPEAAARSFLSMEIDATYDRPTCCVLRFDAGANADPFPSLDLGSALEVTCKDEKGASVRVFVGEVVTVEIDGTYLNTEFTVVAYDKLHRLFRGDKTRPFLKKSVSDIAKQMGGEHGLSPDVTSTTPVHDYLVQENQTDGDYLLQLLQPLDLHLAVEADKLRVKAIASNTAAPVALDPTSNLISFTARATAASIVDKVVVRTWDPKTKKEVIGQATWSQGKGKVDDKVTAAKGKLGTHVVTVDRVGGLQATNEALAKSAVQRLVDRNRQFEGRCQGQPALVVDGQVKIEGLSPRFNGAYRLSRVRHTYSHEEGLTTEFACRGGSDESLVQLFARSAASETPSAPSGLASGGAGGGTLTLHRAICTNVKDPEKIGRIKVKFPTLLDGNAVPVESDWLPTVQAGAGNKRGTFLIPEVEDEVLVLSDGRELGTSFVLGGLHNGKDAAPFPFDDAVKSGVVEQRGFATRIGSHLVFDDSSEAVEIRSKDGTKFKLRYDKTAGLVITVDHDIKIEGKKTLTITAEQAITIESKMGKIDLKASKGDLSAAAMNVKLNGTVGAEVGGPKVDVKATGPATVKGNPIMLN